MRTVIVIPARYASTRLPNKILLRETGKYLIEHVYEQALQVPNIAQVIIATDDERIMSAVASFGGKAVMTRPDHVSGTDRVAEVIRALPEVDCVVNIQGDEPLIDPAAVAKLPELLQNDPEAQLATLAVPIADLEGYQNPNCVKVVCDNRGRALYFSRSPIPMVRDSQPNFEKKPPLFLQHLGLYAYRREALLALSQLPPHPLEESEKLEQLRALGNGWKIQVGVISHAGRGVDTPEDYNRFVATYRTLQGNKTG